MLGRKKLEEFLRAEGIDGTAKLGERWYVGKSGGEMELIEFMEFELEISVPGRTPYKVKHKQLTPYGVYSKLSKGMILPVKVHPEKPAKLFLDWDNLQAQGQVTDQADLPENILVAMQRLGVGGGSKKDPKTRLRELDELHKDGLITQEEYQKKRDQILNEL
ncbi:MAG: SHOCT domain-containing protein [Anaerolineales bacterium]|nr:SHOCT domain-containing protein [Anaerolineales bacterium]